MTWEAAPCGGVGLAKPTTPFGFPADAFVRCRVEISVGGVSGLPKNDCGEVSDGALVRQAVAAGPGKCANTELLTKSPGVARHVHTTSVTRSCDRVSTFCSLGEMLVERQTKGEHDRGFSSGGTESGGFGYLPERFERSPFCGNSPDDLNDAGRNHDDGTDRVAGK
jgi:hypothetical protein